VRGPSKDHAVAANTSTTTLSPSPSHTTLLDATRRRSAERGRFVAHAGTDLPQCRVNGAKRIRSLERF
jgi:hypothetical protein